MFRPEFAEVIQQTGMIPLRDLKPLMNNADARDITELKLLQLAFFDDIKFAKQIAATYKMTFIDLAGAKIPDKTIQLIKKTQVIKYRCIPIQKTAKSVSVAVFDPTIADLKAELKKVFQHPVEVIVTNLSSWQKLYSRVKHTFEEIMSSIEEVKPDNHDEKTIEVKVEDIGADVIHHVNKLLADAYVRGASDIHIEPYEDIFRIRFRLDGELFEYERPNINMMLPIISRAKIMAQLDISERRKPQDGRIKLLIAGEPVDYRVSSLPTLFGEKIVMRILDQSNLQLDMTQLGFEKNQLEVFKNGIFQPYGMCLVTGPTGSGKTTTLYSALAELNQINTNISTAEDPVEFNLSGINQVNVKKDIGFTFAAALKAFLRQDPDVIMVGEIRDFETGEIAIEAALTGHLVLSTLHTNDAPSTVTRLVNMGIEPFLVTGAVNVVVAQRLCRKICSECKEEDKRITVDEFVAAGISRKSAEKLKIYRGKGCPHCNGTGYKGRVAIYEVMEMTPAVKMLIIQRCSNDEVKRQAIRDGMKTLRMSALTKLAQGVTTFEEVITNSSSDKL